MKIFLSYNRKNQGFVAHIAEQLKSVSIGLADDVFFDQDKLESGDPWVQEIQDALVNSDACVVFIGEQGIGGWQNKEVLKAINLLENTEASFRIIPVIVPHSNREDVQKSFPWYLADTQWVEFTSPSDADAFHKLTTTLLEKAPLFAVPEGAQPYKGLASFGVDDAAFFFGRTADVNRVFYYHLRLNENPFGKRFLAIIGNSGSGKSSFARAGLLASLKAGRFAGSDTWQQVAFTPDAKPLLNLGIELEKASIIPNATVFAENALENPEEFYTRLGVWGKQLVLLIDQFEEVVTQRSPNKAQKEQENAVRKAFLVNLTEAVKSSHLVCIITMRSDFYASFAPYPDFNHLLRHNNYTLTEIDANTNGIEWERYIRDIIRKPAGLLKVDFENTVVNQIIKDLQPINGVLPVLQLALQQLWALLEKPGRAEDKKKKIVSQDYSSLARDRGIEGIIEEHANAVFENLTQRGTNARRVDLFKAIFIELVEITSSKEDVRKTISLASLRTRLIPRFGEAEVAAMLDELPREKIRLIRIKGDADNQDADKFVDIIHEVLIRKWEKLKGWINDRREAITYRQLLAIDIAQYEKKVGDLYSGRDLKTALTWQKNNPDLIDDRTRAFITESRTRQTAWIGGVAAVLTGLVLFWLGYTNYYIPRHTGLAKYWTERNYELGEVHKLKISGLDKLTNIYLFENLDSLTIDANNLRFRQANLDQLPGHLTYLSIKNAVIDEQLSFKSNTIRELVLAQIVKMEVMPTITLLEKLQTLTLTVLDITSLQGLEKAPQLKTLELSGLAITSLQGLEKAPQLQTLKLSGLAITSLQGLEKAPQLQTLKLYNLGITSLQGLEKAPQLQTLELYGLDSLANLQWLEKAPQLQTLEVSNLRSLTSLQGLEKAPQLQTLKLYNLGITSLQGLEKAPQLQTLKLSGLAITSLQGLEKAPQLQTLKLYNLGSLANLQWLEKAPRLQTLELSDLDSLANLQWLEKAPQLQTLEVSNLRSLTSLQGLEKAPQLQTLKLSNLGSLANLQWLEKAPQLQTLEVSNLRSLANLQWLEKAPQLQTLELSDLDSLTNLQGLEKAPQLQTLKLSNLGITSLQGLEKAPQLQTLELSNSYSLASLQGLERCGHLKKLTVNNLSVYNLVDAPVLLALPLDTLMLTGTSLRRIDSRTAIWKTHVLVYDTDSAGEDKIVEMARNSPDTRFLNVIYLKQKDE